MSKTDPPNPHSDEEIQRRIRQIHLLAKRLPWIVVITVLIAAIVSIIQAFL